MVFISFSVSYSPREVYLSVRPVRPVPGSGGRQRRQPTTSPSPVALGWDRDGSEFIGLGSGRTSRDGSPSETWTTTHGLLRCAGVMSGLWSVLVGHPFPCLDFQCFEPHGRDYRVPVPTGAASTPDGRRGVRRTETSGRGPV